MVMFAALMLNLELPLRRPAGLPQRASARTAGSPTPRFAPGPRRRSWSATPPIAAVGAGQGPLQVPALLPLRRAVRAGHRLLLLPLPALRRWRQSYSAELSGSDDSQFLARLRQPRHRQRAPRAPRSRPRSTPRRRRPPGTALAGRKGAVVAIDYKTGAIQALVSLPSYDPNDLATHDLAAATDGLEAPQRRPGPSRWPTGPPARSTRPARRSSWSPRAAALDVRDERRHHGRRLRRSRCPARPR